MAKSAISARLAAQVQWQHPKVLQGQIDQTQLSIADAPSGAVPFSFMVMGDTDAGTPSARTLSERALGDKEISQFSGVFAEQLRQQMRESRLLLHTGDVTYPTGSYKNYWEGFLRPYQWLLSSIPASPDYRSESVVFKRPILPVPGNHDYAGVRVWPGVRVWQKALRALCDRLRALGINLGHYGGQGGEAYGQTFLDDLQTLSAEQLTAHLATNYGAIAPDAMRASKIAANGIAFDEDGLGSHFNRCLNYRPGQFTRLPNRYYSFRYGGVDFFALDSNTWNTAPEAPEFDQQQLIWLEQALIKSWQTPNTVGRIIYLHHSPYTTEATRWQQSETLWVRRHLRSVLDRVAATVTRASHGPWVDVVISGHAHCLEHVQTLDTGHADAGIDWVVCGGSGASLRRQREAGSDILESLSQGGKSRTQVVAQSRLYAGVHGRSNQQQAFHSFLRIEVQPHQAQKFVIRPFVVSHYPDGWQTKALKPIQVGSQKVGSQKVGSQLGQLAPELLGTRKNKTGLRTGPR
jgi:3',5'-cyclic AMP phosphodiesterase CpdA